jgi:hypothetical protein
LQWRPVDDLQANFIDPQTRKRLLMPVSRKGSGERHCASSGTTIGSIGRLARQPQSAGGLLFKEAATASLETFRGGLPVQSMDRLNDRDELSPSKPRIFAGAGNVVRASVRRRRKQSTGFSHERGGLRPLAASVRAASQLIGLSVRTIWDSYQGRLARTLRMLVAHPQQVPVAATLGERARGAIAMEDPRCTARAARTTENSTVALPLAPSRDSPAPVAGKLDFAAISPHAA